MLGSVYHIVGWLKDKLGKPVNQVWYVEKLNPEGSLVNLVKKRFYRNEDIFDTPVKGKSHVLLSKDTVIREKVRNICIVDIETGEALRFDGNGYVRISPEELDSILTSRDVKEASTGTNVYDVAFVVVVGLLGLVAGLFIGVMVFPQLLHAMGISWW